ncbi:hypothetical protein QNH10_08835 [Sporosarcina thermotolerans]|uniref:hypothetical protein n=1 Tax=Sporosarcina thermotolerans TaxID=633404 RepID=UPI0024BCBA17|nr:hypothetical protein [Sporosarcina thermotolerans]WHT49590.1 hypothetical protein QNH10_08835 [Sporosarcina thermotolerans]
MSNIYGRLDKIIPKIKEDKFIDGRGLGNEISFYVFDYEPQAELIVRDYVEHIKKYFTYEGTDRKIIEFDLYKLLIEITKEKQFLTEFFRWKSDKGKMPFSRR